MDSFLYGVSKHGAMKSPLWEGSVGQLWMHIRIVKVTSYPLNWVMNLLNLGCQLKPFLR